MKIYGSLNKINTSIDRISPQTQNRVNQNSTTKTDTPNKIQIPKDFSKSAGLNKDEQQFFEKLYPKAKNEIRKYMQTQNQVTVEKGKHVDARG